MSLFQVYLPSKDGPMRILSSSTPSINSTSDAFQVFSSTNNPKTIVSYQKGSIMPSFGFDQMVRNSHISRQPYSMEKDPKFLKTLKKFAHIYDKSFPRTPCGHCAILLLDRHITWSEKKEIVEYGLLSMLNIPLTEWVLRKKGIDTKCIAICGICSRRPRNPPNAGPWPDVLLKLPQRSRKFLSLLTLQTSLGRTQNRHGRINPFSTYKTLTGNKLFKPTIPPK